MKWIGRGLFFLFIAALFLFYFHAMEKKGQEKLKLQAHLEELEQQKVALEQEKEALELQIESQKDPQFVELTLMKEMGVVPEGQVKVYFEKEEKP